MLTQLCQYLHNWFTRKPNGTEYPKYSGVFEITNGELNVDGLAEGQYFRIMGSLFNDGVHKYGDEADTLTDEKFDGVVQFMGVPKEVIQLADDIAAWQEKYGDLDSPAMSPYDSESFDGYSYSKQQGYASTGGGMLTSWNAAFAARLQPWRKI